MLNWIVWNRTICVKMDLALNNLQRLICHKTQTTNQPTIYIYIYIIMSCCSLGFPCLSLSLSVSLCLSLSLSLSLSVSLSLALFCYLSLALHSLQSSIVPGRSSRLHPYRAVVSSYKSANTSTSVWCGP